MYKACQDFKSSGIFLAPGSKVRFHVPLLQLLLVSKRETSAGPRNVTGGRAISSDSWWPAAAAWPSLGHAGRLALQAALARSHGECFPRKHLSST